MARVFRKCYGPYSKSFALIFSERNGSFHIGWQEIEDVDLEMCANEGKSVFVFAPHRQMLVEVFSIKYSSCGKKEKRFEIRVHQMIVVPSTTVSSTATIQTVAIPEEVPVGTCFNAECDLAIDCPDINTPYLSCETMECKAGGPPGSP